MKIKKALISVSDKTKVIELAKKLIEFNVEIISTGGTAKTLSEANINYTPIEKVTGNPESFDGRMKTISFQVASALLFKRNNKDHINQAEKLNIEPIDLVVCNLYPFEDVAKANADFETLIENIDIGGPNMIRAAAKNFESVAVLTSADQYEEFLTQFNGETTLEFRKKLALAAFYKTAQYDSFISQTLDSTSDTFSLGKRKELRYGENPHQQAIQYDFSNYNGLSVANAKIHQGKKLSYNNLLDADACWKVVSHTHQALNHNKQVVAVVKHLNPCGIAATDNLLKSLELAWAGDPVSAYGSIITFSSEVTGEIADWIVSKFVEIVIAPNFSPAALEILSTKKNLRVLQTPLKDMSKNEKVYRSIAGAMLVQDEDDYIDREYKSVTKKKIPKELDHLATFGIQVCKHLKSNAICLVTQNKNTDLWLTGAGMGQPNRLDALGMLTMPRFLQKEASLESSILISDAFFPFRDSIDTAYEHNIKYIIQPGGSIKDQEVIDACDEYAMAMSFTGKRHFRH